jgi:putative tryptophan/tyrosine transport system substrate-binding protein
MPSRFAEEISVRFAQLKRREFIKLLGGAAASCPVAAGAQPTRLPTIGYVGGSTPASTSAWTAAFMQRLRELSWVERSNVAMEYRWAEGRTERYTEIAAEFVRLKVDVILTHGTDGTTAAKQATATIAIVFAMVGDPVGSGLVASLARPGGNVTGVSALALEVATKRLGFLRDAVPSLRRLAIMGNADNFSNALEMGEVAATARALGLDVVRFGIRRTEDITRAFEAFKGQADALYVAVDPFALTNGAQINTLALGARLPTIYIGREYSKRVA